MPEDGLTVFLFEGEGYNRLGPVTESEPITAFDPIFEMELQYFDGQATFEQRIKVTDPTPLQISGEIEYQACDDKLCIFRTEPFTFHWMEKVKQQKNLLIPPVVLKPPP